MKRQTLTLLAGAALSALLAINPLAALAQAYPNKPVKVIIPFPPGGTLDAIGRQLALKLSEQTGQQFVVENKPGGNGIIGADAVAKAQADGYTLLFNASTFTTAPMTCFWISVSASYPLWLSKPIVCSICSLRWPARSKSRMMSSNASDSSNCSGKIGRAHV